MTYQISKLYATTAISENVKYVLFVRNNALRYVH